MLYLESALVGTVVGVVMGILGAGGGIIAVPVLTYLLGQSPHDATSGSLVIVALTALATIPAKWRLNQVRLADGVMFGVLSAAGAIAGRLVNHRLDGDVLFLCFGVLLVAVSVLMFRNAAAARRREQQHGAPNAQASTRTEELEQPQVRRPLIMVIAAATVTGFLTGLFGVGGGFAVVPVLILVLGFPVRQATGTSLVVMLIAASVSIATGVAGGHFHVDWPVVLLFLVGSTLAARLGGRFSQRWAPSTLGYLFAMLVLLVGAATAIATVA